MIGSEHGGVGCVPCFVWPGTLAAPPVEPGVVCCCSATLSKGHSMRPLLKRTLTDMTTLHIMFCIFCIHTCLQLLINSTEQLVWGVLLAQSMLPQRFSGVCGWHQQARPAWYLRHVTSCCSPLRLMLLHGPNLWVPKHACRAPYLSIPFGLHSLFTHPRNDCLLTAVRRRRMSSRQLSGMACNVCVLRCCGVLLCA